MKAIVPVPRFDYDFVVIAKDQPQYRQIPALIQAKPLNAPPEYVHTFETITSWRPTVWERLVILFTGRIGIVFLTFGHPFTPMRIYAGAEERWERFSQTGEYARNEDGSHIKYDYPEPPEGK